MLACRITGTGLSAVRLMLGWMSWSGLLCMANSKYSGLVLIFKTPGLHILCPYIVGLGCTTAPTDIHSFAFIEFLWTAFQFAGISGSRHLLKVLGCRALKLTGKVSRCLNLGSYNYLGFAASDEYCTPRVLDALEAYGWASCSSRSDAGVPLPLPPCGG